MTIPTDPIYKIAEAIERLADGQHATAQAIERLADAYLYCNAPEEEGEPQHMGQSLSDAPGRVGQ